MSRNYSARIAKLEQQVEQQLREIRENEGKIRVTAIGILRTEFQLRFLARLIEFLRNHERKDAVRALVQKSWQMITSASDFTERLQATELAKKVEKAVAVCLRQSKSKSKPKLKRDS